MLGYRGAALHTIADRARVTQSGLLHHFPSKEKLLLALLEEHFTVPADVDVCPERPAVMPEIAAAASGLTANYGSWDRALLSVLFGEARPKGRLPFELPSSTDPIEASNPDVPNHAAGPLLDGGFGLRYAVVPQEL